MSKKYRNLNNLSIETDSFPGDLKGFGQWVVAEVPAKTPVLPWTPGGADGWTERANQRDFETARAQAGKHDGYQVGFVFSEEDPFVFLDFDDARNPETGKIDPAVGTLINRVDSYTDISTSGSGLHAIIRGSLPEGIKQVSDSIGDRGAEIEIYDCKRYAVMTGRHLASTPSESRECQPVIDEHAEKHCSISSDTPDEAIETPTYSREEIQQTGETADPDVIWDAIKQTRPSDVRLRSTVTEERSDGTKSLDPSWEQSDSGTRIGQLDDGFVYRKGMVWLDVLKMVALEERIIRGPKAYPEGDDYFDAVDALRERGAPIPEYYEPTDREFELPSVEALQNRSLSVLRERARENGDAWPTTAEVHDRLKARFLRQLRQADHGVIEAPTASGKTHMVATTAWTNNPEVTGDATVLHLSKTRKARSGAYEMSEKAEADVDAVQLCAGGESCPVAKGTYDGDNSFGNEPLDSLIDGDQTVSEWITQQTHGKAIPFGRVHRELEQLCQSRYNEPLPCCRSTPCQSRSQWQDVDTEDGKEPDSCDLIHATHQFAHLSGLIDGANVVFDEQPEFTLDTEELPLKQAVASFLQEVNAPQQTWEDFVQVALGDSQGISQRKLQQAVQTEPADDWYLSTPEAHAYAPAITRALIDAEHVGNQRYAGEVRHQPFYRQGDDSEGSMERVMVVLNERYEFELVKTVPPLRDARCVIGLDAHPTLERWQLDTLSSMPLEQVLSVDERRNWRRFNRGLFVVQVGDADRPLTKARRFIPSRASALVDELTERFSDLRTAITSKAVDDQVEGLLPDSEVAEPVLYYGEELSRNDFTGERVGLLLGCIDPGDDPVLDWLALHDADAAPERSDEACRECDGEGCHERLRDEGCHECLGDGQKRAHGRGFTGPDADLAENLLGSVRETHVAQSIGRYARSPGQADEPTVVFAWTATVADELVDARIPDVRALTETQQSVVQCVRECSGGIPTREVATELEITKEAARQTLTELVGIGPATVQENAGKHGAHLYDINREVSGFLQLSNGDQSS